MYCVTPHDPLSPLPMADEFMQIDKLLAHETTGFNQEQSLDFNKMPVVFADLGLEKAADVNTVQVMGTSGWETLSDYNKHYTNTQNTMPMPFIDLEDSLDSKFVSVTPGEVENDLTVRRFILGADRSQEAGVPALEKKTGLTVNVQARAPNWSNDISTPDIVTYVEQLETEKCPLLDTVSMLWNKKK